MKLLGKIIAIVILLCGLLVLGTCYFQNCRESTPDTVDTPEAKYKVTVLATGNVYFSNEVKTFGTGDKEIHYMFGYWENIKGKYQFRDITLQMDEKIFGEIEVTLNGQN